MAAFAVISFNIPDQATATAVYNALCPGIPFTTWVAAEAAVKAAILAYVSSLVTQQALSAAQTTALAAVAQPTPPALT